METDTVFTYAIHNKYKKTLTCKVSYIYMLALEKFLYQYLSQYIQLQIP